MANQLVVLGLRFSNKDFTAAAVTGTKSEPSLIVAETISCPNGYSRPHTLKWLVQEIESLIVKHDVSKVVIKKAEAAAARGNAYEMRVEHEAAAYVAAANAGNLPAFKKVKATIAKELGQKGKAKYLTNLDTEWISESVPRRTDKIDEAALAGWTEVV